MPEKDTGTQVEIFEPSGSGKMTFDFEVSSLRLGEVYAEIIRQNEENVRRASRSVRATRNIVSTRVSDVNGYFLVGGVILSTFVLAAIFRADELYHEIDALLQGQSLGSELKIVVITPLALGAATFFVWLYHHPKLLRRRRVARWRRVVARTGSGAWTGPQQLLLDADGIEHRIGDRVQRLRWCDIDVIDAIEGDFVMVDFFGALHVVPRGTLHGEQTVEAVLAFARRHHEAAGGGTAGRYVRHVSAHHTPCPVCQHDMYRSASVICPECGVNVVKLPPEEAKTGR